MSCDESWPETYEQADEHELVIDPGCFGHVYPPLFAPQFPVVSASNVDAAAANDVVVQHYGQNVVYGHVMTADKFLIQVTFDVVSVRKPLLSTSALKRRRVTLIFNHDYDRIIFRMETVNLASHDCLSDLRVTLANAIPHRKALVMTGENVSTDVDEEVFAGDGDETYETRDA